MATRGRAMVATGVLVDQHLHGRTCISGREFYLHAQAVATICSQVSKLYYILVRPKTHRTHSRLKAVFILMWHIDGRR